MEKIISSKKRDTVTEYPRMTFQEVLKLVPVGSDLYLNWYKREVYGLIFIKTVFIGNTREIITMEDYYRAYDNNSMVE